MGLATKDVLEAAGTKWNFHRYSPGLVGGLLSSRLTRAISCTRLGELGYHPQVILAGRAINDSMPAHVAVMMIWGLKRGREGSQFLNAEHRRSHQTFVKSLRVKTALRAGLQFLVNLRLLTSHAPPRFLCQVWRRWMVWL